MATRSEEVRSTSEFKCMHPLYHILDSQNGCFCSEMIADHRASFDEECRKIQYEADFARSDRSLRCLSREEDARVLQQRNKDRTDHSLLIDHLIGSHEAAIKNRPGAHESCLCKSDDSMSSFRGRPQASAETPSSKAGARFESKPFSDALEVLNSDKDLFVVFEPYCLPQKCIKNLQTEKQTVTLKAELQKRQHSGRFACHCSSEQPGGGPGINGSLSSLSVREMKRKLRHTFGSSRRKDSDQLPKPRLPHSRSIFGHDCIYSGVEARNPLSSNINAKAKEKLVKKQGLIRVERELLVAGEAETARKKIYVSSDVLSSTSSLQDPWRVMSSLEMDSCFSPRRESQYFSGSAQVSLISPFRQSIYLSPMRTSEDVAPCDGTTGGVRAEMSSSLLDEEEQEARITPSPYIKFNDTPDAVRADDVHQREAPHDAMISNAERAAKIKLMHSIMDSISENETFSNAEDDFQSSPTLDMRDNNKYQEEYQSPVSVLDQFFAEDSSSPSARETLKPRRLHFEEHESASSSHDTPKETNLCQDYTISNYVRLILEASSLSWDQLSAMRLLSEHLLHPALFDQAQFLQFDPHFDTRLLFDHINEVLLETQGSHFVSPYWPAFAKPRMCCLPLEEAVVDEIMRDAEFYLLPRTQRRTLDQLVEKDLLGPRLWPDYRPETEQIILHISEYILEESVLDVILELHS